MPGASTQTCTRHGLAYDPQQHSGCVVCRRNPVVTSIPPPMKAWPVALAGVAVVIAAGIGAVTFWKATVHTTAHERMRDRTQERADKVIDVQRECALRLQTENERCFGHCPAGQTDCGVACLETMSRDLTACGARDVPSKVDTYQFVYGSAGAEEHWLKAGRTAGVGARLRGGCGEIRGPFAARIENEIVRSVVTVSARDATTRRCLTKMFETLPGNDYVGALVVRGNLGGVDYDMGPEPTTTANPLSASVLDGWSYAGPASLVALRERVRAATDAGNVVAVRIARQVVLSSLDAWRVDSLYDVDHRKLSAPDDWVKAVQDKSREEPFFALVLAMLQLNGNGVVYDRRAGEAELERLATDGFPLAKLAAAKLYCDDPEGHDPAANGTTRQREIDVGEAGYPVGYYMAGNSFAADYGAADPAHAMHYWLLAAEAGYAPAQHEYGLALSQSGRPGDILLARTWLEKALAQRYPPARADLERLQTLR